MQDHAVNKISREGCGILPIDYILIISVLFINPIYLLPIIILVRVKTVEYFSTLVDIFLITSVALFYVNREYDVSWAILGADDAPGYIDIYKNSIIMVLITLVA